MKMIIIIIIGIIVCKYQLINCWKGKIAIFQLKRVKGIKVYVE